MFSSAAAASSLQTVSKPGDIRSLRDEQLLARFFHDRDDAAFAAILERHGPLVYGVCQRVLCDANDAEDAFQATFLVLVRKGGTLREPSRLASWLYGVAQRIARKVRAKAALRTRSERQASDMPTSTAASDMTLDELRSILDEEISQLPQKYSLPLVLCYLEGKTNAEAATQLGWPEGSMSRRLSKARDLLRSRLSRRGLALSAALIASVFARRASAAVPQHLLGTTVEAACLVAQGVHVSDVASPACAQAVEELVVGMTVTSKFTISAILAVTALVVVLGVAAWQFDSAAQGASRLNFFRGGSHHALGTTPGNAAGTISLGEGAAGSCGSLSTSLSTQPAATAGCSSAP
jgi:RNA polymerase sigma factor (sigma-70 family)